MKRAAFEAALQRDGYGPAALRTVTKAFRNEPHSHPWHARFLVLEGWFEIRRDGVARRHGPGDICAIAADEIHAEAVGPDGVVYLSGRMGNEQ